MTVDVDDDVTVSGEFYSDRIANFIVTVNDDITIDDDVTDTG